MRRPASVRDEPGGADQSRLLNAAAAGLAPWGLLILVLLLGGIGG